MIGTLSDMSATEYSYNGYKYTAGEYYNEGDDAMSYGYYYGICRE